MHKKIIRRGGLFFEDDVAREEESRKEQEEYGSSQNIERMDGEKYISTTGNDTKSNSDVMEETCVRLISHPTKNRDPKGEDRKSKGKKKMGKEQCLTRRHKPVRIGYHGSYQDEEIGKMVAISVVDRVLKHHATHQNDPKKCRWNNEYIRT